MLVAANLDGGCGKTLFQVAAACAVAAAAKQSLDTVRYVPQARHQHADMESLLGRFAKCLSSGGLPVVCVAEAMPRDKNWPWNLTFPDTPFVLNGYFQCVDSLRDVIFEFCRRLTFSAADVACANSLAPTRRAFALHIRRGDYTEMGFLFTQLQAAYYIGCLRRLPQDVAVLVVSDDIAWCRQQGWLQSPNISFHDLSPGATLLLMASCDGAIIANSTFSLWGALLGCCRAPDTYTVQAPHQWWTVPVNDGHMATWLYPTFFGHQWVRVNDVTGEVVTESRSPYAAIVPLSYCIPDECIVSTCPPKTCEFSDNVSGPYKFGPGDEAAYDAHYACAKFGQTSKKGGWDCLRHYEILAAGCVPVFAKDALPPYGTMVTFPFEASARAYYGITPYESAVNGMLEHARQNCTTSAAARYFCSFFGVNVQRVLLLPGHPGPNYTREFLWIGLARQCESAVCWPELPYMYDDFPVEACASLHGNGFKYTRRLRRSDQQAASRSWTPADVEASIIAKHWDVIIYGKVGPHEGSTGSAAGMPLFSTVTAHYPPGRIAFLYGGDAQQDMTTDSPFRRHVLHHANSGMCFVRELVLPK